ncbi:cell differentiation protein rcd1-like [Aristolochia californica]|uniref:cell differentiation protein rcd1-like n=1 Tax=Aristolochia californica TaxID=171875 RepID=UPI0035E06AA9
MYGVWEVGNKTAVVEEVQWKKEEQWEERSLSFLHDSKIDREFSALKERQIDLWNHEFGWMAIAELILELRGHKTREAVLRALANFLLEKKEEDAENYNRAGFLLFYSYGTMTILLQEVISFYCEMVRGSVNVRSSKRLANVLTLLQTVAANSEIRPKFVHTEVTNFLIPLIMFRSQEETINNVQAISLSVLGILCQAREPQIIQWAIENDIIDASCFALRFGNEISKVVAMHIIEALLQDLIVLNHFFYSLSVGVLLDFIQTLKDLVTLLAAHQDLSPRLLFHIIRCYILICNDPRGLVLVVEFLPSALIDGSLTKLMQEFIVIKKLHNQLLEIIGRNFEISHIIPKCDNVVHNPAKEILSNLEPSIFNLTSAMTTLGL